MVNPWPATGEQKAVRSGVEQVCARFGDGYWRDIDQSGGWPDEFNAAMVEGGWLGVAMPKEVGVELYVALPLSVSEIPSTVYSWGFVSPSPRLSRWKVAA